MVEVENSHVSAPDLPAHYNTVPERGRSGDRMIDDSLAESVVVKIGWAR